MVQLAISAVALALCLFADTGASTASNHSTYLDPSLSPKERAEDLLQRMTWEEKIGQLGGIRRIASTVDGDVFFNETLYSQIRKTQNGQIGYGSQQNLAADILPLANRLREDQINNSRLHIPYITVTDSVNGIYVSGGTFFPGTVSVASSWNVPLYREVVAAIRDEHLAIGTTWVLSPEVDIAKEPRNGRNGEMYGEDPYLVGEFATEYIKVMQEKDEDSYVKVATTIKHWVYGLSNGGVNLASMFGGLNHHILNDLAGPYIKAIREAGPLSVMVSYASVDRVPQHANKYMLQDVLRGILGFKGLLMSDAGGILNLYNEFQIASSQANAALRALRAGVMHELSPRQPASFPFLVDSANDTEVVSLVDESVKAILEIKFATGAFDKALPKLESLNATLRNQRHLDINRNISRESIVLLQNDGILPLKRSNTSRVAVLGPYADIINAGGYAANNVSDPSYGDSFLRSLEKEIGSENVLRYSGVGFPGSNDTSGIEEAVAAAQEAGLAVIVLGSGPGSWNTSDPVVALAQTDGEFYSHASLAFPGLQQQLLDALLDTGVPTVLILSGGQTFILDDSTKRSNAILHSWFGGEFTGDALVEILFGHVNPSGKLTQTFPEADGALPIAYNYLPSDAASTWAFPRLSRYAPIRFGYGLSYTTFEITTPKLQASSNSTVVVVTATVTNTGSVLGKEVVQLYFRPQYSEIEIPVMSLIRFEKLELAPGESKLVTLTVPYNELGYFIDAKWHVDTGVYNFWIGNSSRAEDLQLLNVTIS